MDPKDEELIRLLTDSTNRAVLTVLTDASHGFSVTEIAEQLVSEDEENIRQMALSLHHNYLPRLDDAGLVKYDRDENIVTSENYVASDAEWMNIDVLDELLSRSKQEQRSGESIVGRLEGREKVYNYCRELADRTEDELFLIYSSDDLLDEGCVPQRRKLSSEELNSMPGRKVERHGSFSGIVFQRRSYGIPRWTGCMNSRVILR